MILSSLLLLSPLAAAPAPAAAPLAVQGNLFVIKARHVEIGDGEVMEHAVILVENGEIVTMGQDLPIERGIPVIELDDDQIVMPGFVNPYTRYGMSGRGFDDARPQVMASAELYPSPTYGDFLEQGVTTIAQFPAGQGMPGQAVALRPRGDTAEDMILEDGVYLKAVVGNSSSSKRNVRDGFKKLDQHIKKVEAAREKFDKANSKKKKSSKKDDKGDKDDKKSSSKKTFEAPKMDPRVKPFEALREGKLRALFSVDSSADYVHLVDAIGEEDFEWHLRIPLSRNIDVFHVMDKIADTGCITVMEPLITLVPGTLRQRNLPAEFARAGSRLVLIPRSDSTRGFESFREDIGVMLAAGLDRKDAIRAVTHNPATLLGLGDRIGTLGEGKRANLVVFSGDPFQPGTKIDAVMLDGQFVNGGIDQ